MMIGFLLGSALISSLSAALMDFQLSQKDKTHKLRILRRYLIENNVDARISVPVNQQVVQRLWQRPPLQEEDVPALTMLSYALRSQLRYEMRGPHMQQHALFRLFANVDIGTLQSIC